MVTRQRAPKFRTHLITAMVVTGYYKAGLVEMVPIPTCVQLQTRWRANRFRMGLRTSDKFSKRTEYSGFLAYGTKRRGVSGIGFGGRTFITAGTTPHPGCELFARHRGSLGRHQRFPAGQAC